MLLAPSSDTASFAWCHHMHTKMLISLQMNLHDVNTVLASHHQTQSHPGLSERLPWTPGPPRQRPGSTCWPQCQCACHQHCHLQAGHLPDATYHSRFPSSSLSWGSLLHCIVVARSLLSLAAAGYNTLGREGAGEEITHADNADMMLQCSVPIPPEGGEG